MKDFFKVLLHTAAGAALTGGAAAYSGGANWKTVGVFAALGAGKSAWSLFTKSPLGQKLLGQ